MHVRLSSVTSCLCYFCFLLFVQVTRGSVVITVVVTDKTDRTGANVTLLIIQMEQDVRVFPSLQLECISISAVQGGSTDNSTQ